MNDGELQVLWLRDYATALHHKLNDLSLTPLASRDEIILTTDENWVCREISKCEWHCFQVEAHIPDASTFQALTFFNRSHCSKPYTA